MTWQTILHTDCLLDKRQHCDLQCSLVPWIWIHTFLVDYSCSCVFLQLIHDLADGFLWLTAVCYIKLTWCSVDVNVKGGMSELKTQHSESLFRCLHKIAKSDNYLCHICLAIHPSTWNSSALTGLIVMKFYIWIFLKNLSRKFKFH